MTDQPLFEPGRMVGPNYRVVRCIGRGGMGEVYEVEHVGLGVRYALKTFAYEGEQFGEMLKTKFLEEGQMLARLKHPHLIRVFDLAYDETAKVFYYVMDLVLYKDGNPYSLDDVDRKDLDEDLVFTWFRDACEALDYIHDLGVVHRDIKEANLLLAVDRHVMLSDFGISHIFGDQLVKDGEARKTMPIDDDGSRTVLGTKHYMAPEVEAGEEASPAADAYSLGVTIFRLLTGVWYAPDSQALSLLNNRKYKWATALSWMLAQDPAERPQRLSEVVAFLRKSKQSAKHRMSSLLWVTCGMLVSIVIAGAVWLAIDWVQTTADLAKQAEEARVKQEEERKQREELEKQQAKVRDERERQRKIDELREAEPRKTIEAKPRAEAEGKCKVEETRRKQEEIKRQAEVVPPQKEAEKARCVAEEAKRPKVAEAPTVAYGWYSSDRLHEPCEVKVEWTNGSSSRFLPLTCGGKTFWIGRYPIAVGEWREYKPNDFAELKKIEDAVPLEYGLCPKLTVAQVASLAEFLTARYRKSLPPGYVIRLATPAELAAAIDEKATRARCELTGRDMKECVALEGAVRRVKFMKLKESSGLDRLCKWNDFGVNENGIMIAGLAMPHASGICDLSDAAYPHLVIAAPGK